LVVDEGLESNWNREGTLKEQLNKEYPG